jgi:hypothetical protein
LASYGVLLIAFVVYERFFHERLKRRLKSTARRPNGLSLALDDDTVGDGDGISNNNNNKNDDGKANVIATTLVDDNEDEGKSSPDNSFKASSSPSNSRRNLHQRPSHSLGDRQPLSPQHSSRTLSTGSFSDPMHDSGALFLAPERRDRIDEFANVSPTVPNNPLLRPKQRRRVQVLDAFRGLALLLLLFCDSGGGGYWFFRLSVWNGVTLADLTDTWMVMAMGVALAFSEQAELRRQRLRLLLVWRIAMRSLLLIALGLFLNNGFDPSLWRLPGALQRMGVTYAMTAAMVYFAPRLKMDALSDNSDSRFAFWRDLAPYLIQWLLVVLLFPVLWLIVTFTVHASSCPAGYLGPGGPWLDLVPSVRNCTGGAAGFLDRNIFGGVQHLDRFPSCRVSLEKGRRERKQLLNCHVCCYH